MIGYLFSCLVKFHEIQYWTTLGRCENTVLFCFFLGGGVCVCFSAIDQNYTMNVNETRESMVLYCCSRNSQTLVSTLHSTGTLVLNVNKLKGLGVYFICIY